MRVLDTLAAAYAGAGDFGAAVRVAEGAADRATREGDGELAAQVRLRLEMYRRHQAYAEPERPDANVGGRVKGAGAVGDSVR